MPANSQSITSGFSDVANFQIIPAETVGGWFGLTPTVDTRDEDADFNLDDEDFEDDPNERFRRRVQASTVVALAAEQAEA